MSIDVTYEDDDNYPPYIYNDGAEIVVTIEGDLYARGTHQNSMSADVYNGIDHAWSIDNRFKGSTINRILDDVKPYADELYEQMDVANGKGYYIDEDIGYDIEAKIDNIINEWNENADESNAIELWESSNEYLASWDYVNSPEGLGEVAENSLFYGILFDDDPEDIVDYAYDLYIEDIEDSDINDMLDEIERMHKRYINDHLEDLFYKNFIPRLLKEIPELTYDGKNFFYDGELLE